MVLKKKNCWEYMKCGREPGGGNAEKLGLCPAATDPTLNGFNMGINSGRICWLVAGTFCNESVKGTSAEKKDSCKNCEFYKQVHAEEGMTYISEGNINIFALTHIGLVRKTNEDRYFIKKLADGSILFAIADGLGGEVEGDYAAEIMTGKLSGIQQIPEGNEQEYLTSLAKETDIAITEKMELDPDLNGMGSTLVCVLLRDGVAYWVNVGDSRLYLFHDRKLFQKTEDQTLARFLLKEGEISKEQFSTHYSRNVMDQCIGCGYCEPETGSLEVIEKDLLILTSDGLHGSVNYDTMTSILNDSNDMETKIRALVNTALEAGGKDNITIVAIGI